MKQKKDGKGQVVLTNHAKIESEILKKLLRQATLRALKKAKQQADK